MKTKINRLPCVLLILILALMLIPTTAFATDAPGVTILDGYTASFTLPSRAIWDKDTSTLTLVGYHGGGIDISDEGDGDGSVIINLIGDNSITVAEDFAGMVFNNITSAIFAGSGNLTINVSTGTSNSYSGICLTSDGAGETDLKLNDSCTVTINVTHTKTKSVYGIESDSLHMTRSSLTVAPSAKLNINMTSSGSYSKAIYIQGSANIDGTLNIIGTYTGSNTVYSDQWVAMLATEGTIGRYAHINVNYPNGANSNIFSGFKFGANNNIAIPSIAWTTGTDSKEYRKNSFYMKLSDKHPTLDYYADYVYFTNAYILVGDPVIGQVPETDVLSEDESLCTVESATWLEKGDGSAWNSFATFANGKTYRQSIEVTPAENFNLGRVFFNEREAAYDKITEEYYVDYPLWEWSISDVDLVDETVYVTCKEAGTYRVCFVDYDGKKIKNMAMPTFDLNIGQTKLVMPNTFALSTGDKIFLWKANQIMKPLCKPYVIE